MSFTVWALRSSKYSVDIFSRNCENFSLNCVESLMFQVQIGSFSKLYLKCSSTVTESKTRPVQLVNPYLKIYSLILPSDTDTITTFQGSYIWRATATRRKSDFELILCSIFVNENIFPTARCLNSNKQTSSCFTARRVQALKCKY